MSESPQPGPEQLSGRNDPAFDAAWQDRHREDHALADRLDAVEAERVFARALELEAEAIEQPHLFTPAQLERIAAEVNMDVAFVRQALGEVRMTPAERRWLDRRILPDPLMHSQTIEGLNRAELDAALDDWMTDYEGLIASGRLDDGTVWDVDRRLAARIKAMRAAGGNRISRVAGGDVAHRIHTIGDDEHVIALQSRGEGPLLLAKVGLALAALVVGYGLVSGIDASLQGFLERAAYSLVIGSATAAAAVAGARRWAKGIGRALRRSLTGLAARLNPARRQRAGPRDIAPVAAELMSILAEKVRERRRNR